MPSERASQDDQNSANFSFLALSSVSNFSKSAAVTTFTMRIHLNGRQVSVPITLHWKVL